MCVKIPNKCFFCHCSLENEIINNRMIYLDKGVIVYCQDCYMHEWDETIINAICDGCKKKINYRFKEEYIIHSINWDITPNPNVARKRKSYCDKCYKDMFVEDKIPKIDWIVLFSCIEEYLTIYKDHEWYRDRTGFEMFHYLMSTKRKIPLDRKSLSCYLSSLFSGMFDQSIDRHCKWIAINHIVNNYFIKMDKNK